MGAFVNQRGSVASMASMFERSSLAESQQAVGESRTRCPPASTNLSSSNIFPISRSPDRSKSPPINTKAAEEYNAEDNEVFSCSSPDLTCQMTSLLDSVTSANSNISQPHVSVEQKNFELENKVSTNCSSVSKQPPVEKQEYSVTRNVAAKSGSLWSAPHLKKQVRNIHSSSFHPTDQPPINSSTTVRSATRSRASRRQRLSYDAAAGLDLSSADSQSSGRVIQRTLKKSHTVDMDVLSIQAPKVTVTISSKKVDHCQLDMLTRYRQASPAVVHVAGDSELD